MRQIIITLLIFLAASIAAGQTPGNSAPPQNCNLTAARSPEIRGLRLGMSAESLRALFPQEANQNNIRQALSLAQQPDRYGVGLANLYISRGDARYVNVSNISVTLLDERIVAFHVSYIRPRWDNVDQFVNRLAESFNLPRAEAWAMGSSDTIKVLTCNGLRISAEIRTENYGGSTLSVADSSLTETVEARQRETRAREQREFVP